MSDITIRVDRLGKRYRIGQARESYYTLRDQIRVWASPRSWFRPSTARPDITELWALKDVSFDVKRGDVVGIIGRNGAGKSTLLKVLSRITEPTEGSAEIVGRVGSLLEVGTGFHQELTGRENVYLNGAILGMKRAEVMRKFDEIIAFAEVQRFVDTPVKHYSSGMYLRLAFAVAAFLEPEILVVDEVLAVGDAAFQKKCLGRMQTVSQQGRTVLFVSHNMGIVQRLCTRGLVLDLGRVNYSGTMREAIARYLSLLETPGEEQDHFRLQARDSTGGFRLTGLRIAPTRPGAAAVSVGEPLDLIVEFESTARKRNLVLGIEVLTQDLEPLFATHSDDLGPAWDVGPGAWTARVRMEPNYLRPGKYYVNVAAWEPHGTLAVAPSAGFLQVAEVMYRDAQKSHGGRPGHLYVPLHWERTGGTPGAGG